MSDDFLFINGRKDAPILVITEPPEEDAYERGQALAQNERRFFRTVVESYGMMLDDFAFLPACAAMSENVVTDREQAEHVAADNAEFWRKFRSCTPRMVIPMGKHALRQLSGRSAQIGKARGHLAKIDHINIPVLPMTGIRQCLWFPENIPVFTSDFNLAHILSENDFDPESLGTANLGNTDYFWCDDIQDLLDDRPRYIAVDTETTGLKWTDPNVRVLTVQITPEPGVSYVIPVDTRAHTAIWPDMDARTRGRRLIKLKRQLKDLLEDESVGKILSNGKFDFHQCRESLGIKIKGWRGETQQLAFVVDENMQQKGLDEVTRRWSPELAGYADCVVPETLILTADMRKVRADSLKPWDALCAFTAETDGRKASRRTMQLSLVEGVQRLTRPCLEITTASGRKTTVSEGHLLLTKLGDHDKGGGWRWRRADSLKPGMVLKPFPWEDRLETYDAGYVAGVLDGEGWVCDGKSRLGFAQRRNEVLRKTMETIRAAEIDCGHYADRRKTDHVVNVTFDGANCFRMLQKFGPERLLQAAAWQGCGLPTNWMRHDEIVSIQPVGEREVIGLKTSTQTIIADGLCQHNSFNATVDKSDMLGLLRKDPDKFLRYAGGDTDASFRVGAVLMKLGYQDERQWQLYKAVQLPALQAFADRIETTGMAVDRNRLAELEIEIAEKTEEMHNAALSQASPALRRKHLKAGLKLTRPALVSDMLFTKDGLDLQPIVFTKGTRHLPDAEKVPSTSGKDHLTYFATEPLVKGIMDWGKYEKMRTTYVGKEFDPDKGEPTGFWKHLVRRGDNYWIHPSFFLHRAVTGRTSSADPNAQNFPKRGKLAKQFRSIFIAPPGWKLVEVDLSQAEIRIAASEAGEREMIRLYNEGVDIHANTGSAITGNDVNRVLANKNSEDLLMDIRRDWPGAEDFLRKMENDELRRNATLADFIGQIRFQAKAVNFGFLYGMQWRGFKTYAKLDYSIDYTDTQAQDIRANFFTTYPDLIPWHQRVERFVYEHGYVRSLHGALRRLPSIYSTRRGVQAEAVRQAINSPVQRLASDLGVMALWRLCRDAPADLIRPVAFIHDAVLAYVREDYAMEGAGAIRWYMQNNPLENWFDLTLPLPIVADASIGDRLSEVREVHVDAVAPEWWNQEADEGEPAYVFQTN